MFGRYQAIFGFVDLFLAEEGCIILCYIYKGESNEFCANAPFFICRADCIRELLDASRKYKIAQTRCLSEKAVYIWN